MFIEILKVLHGNNLFHDFFEQLTYFYFIFMNVFACVDVGVPCVCVCMCGAYGGQKWASGPLELELELVVSH